MLSWVLKHLKRLGGQTTPGASTANQQIIFLHGSDELGVDVLGVSQHQQIIHQAYSIVGESAPGEHLATLILNTENLEKNPEINVALNDNIIGRCPAPFSNNYVSWLQKWNLLESTVWCKAIIIRRQNLNKEGEYIYSVRLAIEQPFKMTTLQTR